MDMVRKNSIIYECSEYGLVHFNDSTELGSTHLVTERNAMIQIPVDLCIFVK
jgi:hypothetical protein